MQVTQTLTEGLKQEFKVVLASADLAAKLDSKLEEFRSKAQLKGFRPGKAPVSHLRKIYGREIMGEIVETAVNDANRQIIEDNNLRLATQPKLDFPGGQDEVEKVLSSAGDLAYVVSFETLPKIELGSFDDIAIERPVSDVTDEDVDKAIRDLVERVRDYEPTEEGYKAATGDRVTIDFAGKIDGEPFEGGAGEDLPVVLGSNTFIPGFEDQLVGAAVGEQRLVTARFPDNYSVQSLAGREAAFDTTVKAIEKPKPLEIDDELAKKWGFDTLEAFKSAVRANVEADFDKASRDKVKRALLDALDERYKFEVPESLTSMEFDGIWREFEAERKAPGAEPETKSEDELRAEYRAIAERRVRLGLLLAEIGQSAGVTVEDKDLTQALVERARQFPGQEKAVWDYYRNNEQALSTLRAPIYEEHVVRHLSGVVRMADKKVSREELFADEEEAKPAA
ncbi:MAG TPA: trigger factor [Methylocystis sp.]|nr:trigger factor [Methylocystis sp.]